MAIDQVRRQMAFSNHALLAVDIAQQRIGQAGALDHGGFDIAPVRRRKNEGDDIELPGPGLPRRLVIDIIGDAIVAHHRTRRGAAAGIFLRRKPRQGFGEGAPVWTDQPFRVAQFVETGGPGTGRLGE